MTRENREIEVIHGRLKQTFTEQEKKRIVESSYESTLSLNKFARRTGISPATLCQWRKQFLERRHTDDVRAVTSQPEPLFKRLESVLEDNERLTLEVRGLRQELFKLKAFVGHKLFELEAIPAPTAYA